MTGHDHEGSHESDPGGVEDLAATPDCQATLTEIYGYLDGELTPDRRARISEHLDGCDPCLACFDFEAELRMVVARRCRDDVPESLRRRIAAALRQSADS